MSTRTLPLTDELYPYLIEHSLREPPVLARLRDRTARLPLVNMQISPEQGQFLALLVRLIGARRCLEIGTFTGYSSTAVALALPRSARVVCLDVSAEWTAIARETWREAGVEEKIELRLGQATEFLATWNQQDAPPEFDFVFIDADKANYLTYYESVLGLLRPGGLIAVDNTLWGGRVAAPDVDDAQTRAIRAFNDLLLGDQRVDLSLVPIGDGLTLARKREV